MDFRAAFRVRSPRLIGPPRNRAGRSPRTMSEAVIRPIDKPSSIRSKAARSSSWQLRVKGTLARRTSNEYPRPRRLAGRRKPISAGRFAPTKSMTCGIKGSTRRHLASLWLAVDLTEFSF